MEWAMKAKDDGAVAILHLMEAGDDFDDTADILFQLVRQAVREHPGRPRWLYLDIEGHRNSAGGFDADSYEIQKEFAIGFLGRWLTRICTPLVEVVTAGVQHEDLPEHLVTAPGGESAEGEQTLPSFATNARVATYDADTGEVEVDGTRRKHY